MSGFVSGRVNGVGQKRKTVKNGGNPPFLCFFVRIMYSFALCGVFLVFVHGIGGGDRFSEIVRSVSLVVICGYNTRRAKKDIVCGGRREHRRFFYAHEPQRIAGKNLVANIQGSDYKKAHNVYYV